MYLSKIGFSNNYLILKSLLFSKFLQFNPYTFPKSKFIKLKFPLFDSYEFNKSKLLIIVLDFLEQMTYVKPLITHAKILIKKGVFYKCQIILTKLYYMNFLIFLNEFILNNSLLKFTNKQLKLSQLNNNTIALFLFDLDFFFDVYSRKLLPNSKFFWLEIEFYFNKNYKLLHNLNLKLYSQLFFCHNILEWYTK
jgi:hypothetical protein